MIRFRSSQLVFLIVLLFMSLFWGNVAAAAGLRVLTVFSFEPGTGRNDQMRETIEQVLGDAAELTFFYLDTKNHPEQGALRAREAAALFDKIKPDGVIAVDDAAMSLFVLPYLKDKTEVPVTFCGVNDLSIRGKIDSGSGSISGIFEKFYIEETLAMASGLIGPVRRFAFMMADGTTAHYVRQQLDLENGSFSAELIGDFYPRTLDEAYAAIAQVRDQIDLLIVASLRGLHDSSGQIMNYEDAVPLLRTAADKPIAAVTRGGIKFGALCGVIIDLKEQSYWAAQMLLAALQSRTLPEHETMYNMRGISIVNVSEMQRLGISPDPVFLRGVELIK